MRKWVSSYSVSSTGLPKTTSSLSVVAWSNDNSFSKYVDWLQTTCVMTYVYVKNDSRMDDQVNFWIYVIHWIAFLLIIKGKLCYLGRLYWDNLQLEFRKLCSKGNIVNSYICSIYFLYRMLLIIVKLQCKSIFQGQWQRNSTNKSDLLQQDLKPCTARVYHSQNLN